MISIGEMIKFFKEHNFEIVVGLCLLFLAISWIYNKIRGIKGTWNKFDIRKLFRLSSYSPKQSKVVTPKKSGGDSKGEVECRRVLKKFFGEEFNKIRPDFLKNMVTGSKSNLEIDCFCSKMNLGIEYSGRQHYEYVPYFHKNKEAFQNQQYRDYMKRRMCEDNGITLIEVPYTVKIKDIESYLYTALKKKKII